MREDTTIEKLRETADLFTQFAEILNTACDEAEAAGFETLLLHGGGVYNFHIPRTRAWLRKVEADTEEQIDAAARGKKSHAEISKAQDDRAKPARRKTKKKSTKK